MTMTIDEAFDAIEEQVSRLMEAEAYRLRQAAAPDDLATHMAFGHIARAAIAIARTLATDIHRIVDALESRAAQGRTVTVDNRE